MSDKNLDWRMSLFAKEMRDKGGQSISAEDAFEILCAQAICMEPFPNEIKVIGKANGWYNRIRMLADGFGWQITITIEDKK